MYCIDSSLYSSKKVILNWLWISRVNSNFRLKIEDHDNKDDDDDDCTKELPPAGSPEFILAQQTVWHSSSFQTTPWPQGLNAQEDETCLVLVYWKTEEFVSKQVLHVNTMTAQVILNLLLLAYASATFTFYSE